MSGSSAPGHPVPSDRGLTDDEGETDEENDTQNVLSAGEEHSPESAQTCKTG